MALGEGFNYSDCLVSNVDGGRVTISLGDSRYDNGETEGFAFDCQSIATTDGFYSVPAIADEFGAPQAFSYSYGNETFVLGTWDNRSIANAGNMQPGDRAIVTKGPARILIKDASDSINILTKSSLLPGDKPDMGISVDGERGMITIHNGTSYMQVLDNEITISAGKTQLVINAKGVTITGENFMCNTGGGNLGLLAPPTTPPIKGVNSVLYGPMGQAGVASMSWTVNK